MSKLFFMSVGISTLLPLILRIQQVNAEQPSSNLAKPNILFILTDDPGWRDLSCYGSDFYETPNIDRLASQGMRFTDAHAAASARAANHWCRYFMGPPLRQMDFSKTTCRS